MVVPEREGLRENQSCINATPSNGAYELRRQSLAQTNPPRMHAVVVIHHR
jgi:hypothetical protein